jgi:hypothetical protein
MKNKKHSKKREREWRLTEQEIGDRRRENIKENEIMKSIEEKEKKVTEKI